MSNSTTKGSNIVQGIQHLRLAKDFFEDFIRSYPGTKGAALFTQYNKRIDWILNDLITNPALPEKVVEGIKQELKSDLLAIPAIMDKIVLLKPDQREALEAVCDDLLSGKQLIVENVNL